MSDIPVEKKLAALQQIRSTYNKNQYELTKREQILYGKATAREYVDNSYNNLVYKNTASQNMSYSNIDADATMPEAPTMSFVRLRFVLAIAIMVGFIVLDQNSQSIAGMPVTSIFEAISYDYTDMIEEWIHR